MRGALAWRLRHLRVASARRLLALDSARQRRRRASTSTRARGSAANAGASGVLVAVAHWRGEAGAPAAAGAPPGSRDPDRSQILGESIDSLLDLDVDRIVLAVLTNEPRQTFRDLSARPATSSNVVGASILPNIASFDARDHPHGRQIVVIGWRPTLLRRHGFYLTWAHKALFRHALVDAGFSHFIYLEDDLMLTRTSFSYWCRLREPLARHGLLPGFVRFETLDGARYAVDPRGRQDLDRPDQRCLVLSDSAIDLGSGPELRFVSLSNPYQAMYILDRELAIDHLRSSPARSPLLSRAIRWPECIRERAALGPILDDVPAGFGSRNVVPLQERAPGEYRLDSRCLIEHLTGNKSRSPDRRHSMVRVEDLFLPATRDPRGPEILSAS